MIQRRQLTLYTRHECHLCDAARFVIERVGREIPLELACVDIDSDGELRKLYNHHVPVLLIDGVEHARHRVDEAELRAVLRRRGKSD